MLDQGDRGIPANQLKVSLFVFSIHFFKDHNCTYVSHIYIGQSMSPASSLWKSFTDKLKLIYLTRVCDALCDVCLYMHFYLSSKGMR